MVEMVTFDTDAAAVDGVGIETLSEETFFISPGMAIVDLFQTPGAVLANDADWQLFIDGIGTRYTWTAEELDPVAMASSKGRLPTSINISPGRLVQLRWMDQGAAQANRLKVMYERVR